MPPMICSAPMVRVRVGRSWSSPIRAFYGLGPCFQASASFCGRTTAITPSPIRAMAVKCFQRLDARDISVHLRG